MKVVIHTKHLRGEEGYIKFAKYRSGEIAIEALDTFGEPLIRYTLSMIPYAKEELAFLGYDVSAGDICIKSYSENEGALQSLIDCKIIYPNHKFFQYNGVTIYIGRLTDWALKEFKKQEEVWA